MARSRSATPVRAAPSAPASSTKPSRRATAASIEAAPAPKQSAPATAAVAGSAAPAEDFNAVAVLGFIAFIAALSYQAFNLDAVAAPLLGPWQSALLLLAPVLSVLYYAAKRVNERTTDATAYGSLIILCLALFAASQLIRDLENADFFARATDVKDKTPRWIADVADFASYGFLAWAFLPLNFHKQEDWTVTALVFLGSLFYDFAFPGTVNEGSFFEAGVKGLKSAYIPSDWTTLKSIQPCLVAFVMLFTCSIEFGRAVAALRASSVDRTRSQRAAIGLTFLSPRFVKTILAIATSRFPGAKVALEYTAKVSGLALLCWST